MWARQRNRRKFLSMGPFLRAARRIRRAPLDATGSPRFRTSGVVGHDPWSGDLVAAVSVSRSRHPAEVEQFDPVRRGHSPNATNVTLSNYSGVSSHSMRWSMGYSVARSCCRSKRRTTSRRGRSYRQLQSVSDGGIPWRKLSSARLQAVSKDLRSCPSARASPPSSPS